MYITLIIKRKCNSGKKNIKNANKGTENKSKYRQPCPCPARLVLFWGGWGVEWGESSSLIGLRKNWKTLLTDFFGLSKIVGSSFSKIYWWSSSSGGAPGGGIDDAMVNIKQTISYSYNKLVYKQVQCERRVIIRKKGTVDGWKILFRFWKVVGKISKLWTGKSTAEVTNKWIYKK